jgi:hypothetical protein
MLRRILRALVGAPSIPSSGVQVIDVRLLDGYAPPSASMTPRGLDWLDPPLPVANYRPGPPTDFAG